MAVWERRQGESAKAYQAFVIYRDLGAERSTSKVAQKLSKSEQLIRRWSAKHEWQQRVEAWDAEQQSHADEVLLKTLSDTIAEEREALIRRELADFEHMLELYDQAMQHARMINREQTGFTVDPATGKTVKVITLRMNLLEHWRLTRWRMDIARMGRLALGLPTTVRESRLADENGDALPITALLDDGEDDEET